MVSEKKMSCLLESERRRDGAAGISIRLANGESWLLARPVFCAEGHFLTTPYVDDVLDRLFSSLVLEKSVLLLDVWTACARLLLPNYDLTLDEIGFLLEVCDEIDAEVLASTVMSALLGDNDREWTFSDWVSNSLLCSGLGGIKINSSMLGRILSLLVETKRTSSATRYCDVFRLAEELQQRDALL